MSRRHLGNLQEVQRKQYDSADATLALLCKGKLLFEDFPVDGYPSANY